MAALLLICPAAQAAGVAETLGGTIEDSPITFLPLGRNLVPKELVGLLPLPIGLSANFIYESQDLKIERINSVSIAGRPVPPEILKQAKFSKIDTGSYGIEGRFDAWLLPFLDAYAVGGYESGTAKLNVTFPGIVDNRRVKENYTVWTWGGGGTLAGGYDRFFTAIDLNYTFSAVDVVDNTVETFVFDPRIGFRDPFPLIGGAAWVGAMYQEPSQLQVGTTSFGDIRDIDFSVDVKALGPWTAQIGAALYISRHLELMLEGGIGTGRQSFMCSIMGRL